MKIHEIWAGILLTILILVFSYTILRQDNWRKERQKLELIRELALTQNRLEIELDIRYIDSLKQEINK